MPLWDKEYPKISMSSFSNRHFLLGMHPSCRSGLSPSKIFICKWLSVGDCFEVLDGDFLYLLPSSLLAPHPVQNHEGSIHATWVSVRSYWINLVVLEDLYFLVVCIPSGSYSLFLPHLPQDSLNPAGRDRDIHF